MCNFQSVLQLLLFVGRLPRGQLSPAPSCLSDCENVCLFFFYIYFSRITTSFSQSRVCFVASNKTSIDLFLFVYGINSIYYAFICNSSF